MKTTFVLSALALVLCFSSASSAQNPSGCEVQEEMIHLQNWFIEKIATDFNVLVAVKNQSTEALKQLRILHDFLKNHQSFDYNQFDQIEVLCKRADCN